MLYTLDTKVWMKVTPDNRHVETGPKITRVVGTQDPLAIFERPQNTCNIHIAKECLEFIHCFRNWMTW